MTKRPTRLQVADLRARGLTLAQAGEALGVSRTRIWQIEGEERQRAPVEARHQAVRELAAKGDRTALLATLVTDVVFEGVYMGTNLRVQNCLRNDNIKTLGELLQRYPSELLRTPNFGRKSLTTVIAVLAELGLELAPEPRFRGAFRVPPLVAAVRIEDLDLPIRVFNCLTHAGIVTVCDLANRSRADLLKLPNFGKTSLAEVAEILYSLGVVGWPPR